MRKTVLFAALALLMVITACKPATSTATSSTKMECTIASSVFPAPKAESAKVFAPITSSDHVKGPDTAVMTIIEYSDYT